MKPSLSRERQKPLPRDDRKPNPVPSDSRQNLRDSSRTILCGTAQVCSPPETIIVSAIVKVRGSRMMNVRSEFPRTGASGLRSEPVFARRIENHGVAYCANSACVSASAIALFILAASRVNRATLRKSLFLDALSEACRIAESSVERCSR